MDSWVAYLESDCSLIDVYRVGRWPGEGVWSALAGDVATRREQWQRVLVGRPAELLHIAITGRVGGCAPEDAGVWIALRARETLAGNLDQPGFAEAYAAVAVGFADFIRPFYGVALLSDEGRILVDDARYEIELDLPMTVGEGNRSGERGAVFGGN